MSDIVTPYDLPYQAKAALCNYVPKLRKTYNAIRSSLVAVKGELTRLNLFT
ncbi:hypothetical protein SAMN06265347_1251 [Halobellus salinus]|nr:hypothetical protein SAMN06265347_1251 [Halobellus salinus]